jgi:hypothetical protein
VVETSGFPTWRILRAVRHQAQEDLLSLAGAYATAIVLGLASEIFPDAPGSNLEHRIQHGLEIVVCALAVISLMDGARRFALYRHNSRQAWSITSGDFAGLLGFGIDSRKPSIEIPERLMVVIRTPSGRYLQEQSNPNVIDGGGVVPYPPGEWFHIAEQPYERGAYEIRAYGTRHFYELTRATLIV